MQQNFQKSCKKTTFSLVCCPDVLLIRFSPGHDDDDDVSGSAQVKRAKKINNIFDHTTEKDKDAKASLMARIIDTRGS